MDQRGSAPDAGLTAPGLMFGLVALAGWTGYVIIARHGALAGLSAFDLAVARLAPAGILFLPFLIRWGLRDLGGVGWGRGLALALFGGPLFGFLMAGGFSFAPVTHGAVIGPATLTLMTTLIAVLWLGERPGRIRYAGLAVVVAGILLVGGGAFQTGGGVDVLIGDACLIGGNASFAVFTILLRRWSVPPLRGAAVVTVVSLVTMLPVYLMFADLKAVAAVGWDELALQWIGQGVFAGCIATVAFMAAVARLGASRGAVFPSAIPATAVLAGAPLLAEYPSQLQIAGVAIVSIGLLMAVGLLDRLGR